MKDGAATWMELKKLLPTADERKCIELMQREIKAHRRPMFLMRIYGRFSRLRSDRERSEMLKFYKLPR